jgi:hypothetical protein
MPKLDNPLVLGHLKKNCKAEQNILVILKKNCEHIVMPICVVMMSDCQKMIKLWFSVFELIKA